MLQGVQGGLRLVASEGQLGAERAGEDLLGRRQLVELDQIEDLLGLGQVVLAEGLVGGGQAQQGRLLRLALLRLLQELLGAGLGFLRQLAEAGGLLAGAGGQQAGQAEEERGRSLAIMSEVPIRRLESGDCTQAPSRVRSCRGETATMPHFDLMGC